MSQPFSKPKKRKKSMSHRTRSSEVRPSIAKLLLLPPLVGAATLCTVLLLATAILSRIDDPHAYSNVAICLACIASGGACGFCATRLSGRPFPWSLIGICLLLSLESLSVFLLGLSADSERPFRITLLVCSVVSALIFSAIARKNPHNTRRRAE